MAIMTPLRERLSHGQCLPILQPGFRHGSLIKLWLDPDSSFFERTIMRPHHLACCFAAFGLFLILETSASAQGTDQQRQACTPDAFRLCGAYIPDAERITACLRGNGPRLSRPCYDVFFPPQPQTQYAPPQDRDPRRRYQRSAPGPYYEDDDN
jgi:hypothetical protein